MNSIYALQGTVKHYDWGGFSFIADLLKLENPEHKPFAEYWMSTHVHDKSAIQLDDQKTVLLKNYIEKNPATLGSVVLNKFGHLPYLLKILDVKDMLSIQVHPSKATAEKEFEKENSTGVPHDAAHRNYKDSNHKPELMVALDEFWLLHGFKPKDILLRTLKALPELNLFIPVFEQHGYKGLYQFVMEMSQSEVNKILDPLVARILPLYQSGELNKVEEGFWAARASITFSKGKDHDRGIFSVYFFNLVNLKKGEGVFQQAGLPHAYLEGQNAEIMANSDNVLRGGLTNKHVDVPELMKNIIFEETVPDVLSGARVGLRERVYKTPAPDFELSVFEMLLNETTDFTPVTAEILLLTEGIATLECGNNSVILERGRPSAIAFPGNKVKLSAMTKTTIFRASVPIHTS